MKKTKIVLLSLLFIAGSAASLLLTNNSKAANAAEAETIFCDIGPAKFNDKQTETPLDKFNGNNYSISIRGGKLLIYVNNDYYKNSPRAGSISTNELVDTNFNFIRFYTDENNYKLLPEYFATLPSYQYTVYNDAGLNIAFDLNTSLFRIKDIYQITFNEGLVFPYASEDHSKKLVLKQSLIFKYNDYHGADVDDTFFSSSWSKLINKKEEEEKKDIELIDIAAFAREKGDYRAHVRGYIYDYEKQDLDTDDGTARLFIFFGNNDYNPDIYNQSNVKLNAKNFDISDSSTSYIHTLYEKIFVTSKEGVVKTLLEIANPNEKGVPEYNSWGEFGSLVFNIGNSYGGAESFCGTDVAYISIARGCQFPKFSYTNGGDLVETRYSQIDDITLNMLSPRALWSTSSEYCFNAADIEVSNFACRSVDVHSNSIDVTGTVIDIEMSENNYDGLINFEINIIGEVFTKYVYVNGRSLFYAFGNSHIRLFANLDGKVNTISVLIPLEASNVKEIIVQKGCSIPAAVSSNKSMEVYGNSISYYVSKSHSYSGSGTSFTEDAKIYWTLWFDGKNPKRVSNASTFDFDTVEPGESDETRRFVRWIDSNENAVTGYSKITSGKEYFGEYIYCHLVTVTGLEKTLQFRVDNYTRLTEFDDFKKYVNPTKSGFDFNGWELENGDHYNINNRIIQDTTIVATWRKATNSNNNAVLITIIVSGSVFALSIGAIVFAFVYKKHKKVEDK